MRNIFRLGSNKPSKTQIKKITVVSICVYLVCALCIFWLFTIDTNVNNLTPMVRFIENEHVYLYNGDFYPLQFKDSDKYIHSIRADYIGTKLNAQFSDFCNVITDQDSVIPKTVDSIESAEEFVNNLLPDGVLSANNWVRMFINKYTYYDLLSVIDPDCEDYWEIRSYAWEHIVLHSGYNNVNFYSFLYGHISDIVACYVLIIMITFSLDIGYLVVYFCRVFKTKGANRNDVFRET